MYFVFYALGNVLLFSIDFHVLLLLPNIILITHQLSESLVNKSRQ